MSDEAQVNQTEETQNTEVQATETQADQEVQVDTTYSQEQPAEKSTEA